MTSLIIEPKRRHQYQFVWLIAAGLVSAMFWYSGWLLYRSFGETYERVVSAVSGEK